jgi:DNA-binding transcriptional MerR regulator
MKPEELARRLDVTSAALRKWAGRDYAEFLSPSAQGLNGARRAFSDQDARIIAWIVQLKNDNIPAKEIIQILRNAQANEWRDLPELPNTAEDQIALMPREAVEERLQAMKEKFELQLQAAIKERDELQARLSRVEAENSDLRQQLRAITDRILTLLEQERQGRKRRK